MKKEQLIELGIDEETVKKVMDINGADIEAAKRLLSDKLTKAEGERDGLQAQLATANETLEGFKDIDPKELQTKLEQAQTALAEAKKTYETDIAARDSKAETEKFIAQYEADNKKQFTNEITRAHYINEIEQALVDTANKGKNRLDIFTAMTVGEDGNPKPGVFHEENPNPLLRNGDLPPAGVGGQPDEFSFGFTPIR